MYTVYSFIYPFGLFFVFAYFLCINDMYIHIMYIYIYTIFLPPRQHKGWQRDDTTKKTNCCNFYSKTSITIQQVVLTGPNPIWIPPFVGHHQTSIRWKNLKVCGDFPEHLGQKDDAKKAATKVEDMKVDFEYARLGGIVSSFTRSLGRFFAAWDCVTLQYWSFRTSTEFLL